PRRPSRSSAQVPAHGKNIRATPAVPSPNDALPCLPLLSPTLFRPIRENDVGRHPPLKGAPLRRNYDERAQRLSSGRAILECAERRNATPAAAASAALRPGRWKALENR